MSALEIYVHRVSVAILIKLPNYELNLRLLAKKNMLIRNDRKN